MSILINKDTTFIIQGITGREAISLTRENLDYGAQIVGNPSVKKACELTKVVLSKPGVDKIAVIMNVVSNTRVDIVALGVVKGVIESGFDPAEKIVFFRIPGAWEGEGFKILEKYGVEYCDRTVSMSEAARRAVEKLRAEA